MKKYFISFFCFLISFYSFSTTHNCRDGNCSDEYAVRYIKDKKPIDANFQKTLRDQSLWQNFLQDHPKWYVIFNENNLLPHRAFGTPVQLSNGISVGDRVLNFLSDHNFTLPNDLRLENIKKNDKHINVHFKQYHNDLEVIDSRLYAKLSLNDELLVFGLDIFNDITISLNPTITEEAAILSASSDIAYPITKSMVEENLRILPVPTNQGSYNYHLVYVVNIETRIEVGPANYECYVDANSGILLMRNNKVLYEAPPSSAVVNVQGEVYTTNPFNPSSIEKMINLRANYSGSNYFTDNSGNVNIPSNFGSVSYFLDGQYAEVRTNSYVPNFTSSASNTNVSFDNSNSTIQERTAYHAVNEIHAHLKSVFPNFTGLDFPLETNVDEAGSCNAYYNGSSINFYAEGAGCAATAKLPDVVYHEYGHAINGWRYGSGMQNGGQNEGYADIWAISLAQNPVLGFGWDLVDPNVYVRRYDINKKVYPQDLTGEVHADGEIIAGCFWDTYLNLGSMTQMLDLFKYTFDGAPQAPNGDEGVLYTDVLLEVLYGDDNDNDLTNGTPNDDDIVSAFALHGITLLSNANLNHNPVETSNSNSAINLNTSISMTYPWALSTADCYYRINSDTSWNHLSMTLTGTGNNQNAQATISGQPDGTVIAYYISLTDIYGYQSAITPMAANISPVNNANVPYFILVGYNLVAEEDFDFNVGFWQTGDPGDLATTGMWEIGSPIASYDNPQQMSGIVQTGSQHTPGGFSCAFTQNASSIFDGIGANDVDGGHTTLYSPYFDMTSYTNPAISYYRWYTNSPASGANPNADWWQVLITDDGVNWKYVENNKSSEIDWRRYAFRVQDYVNLTSLVQLKFIASDSLRPGQNLDGGSLVEAAVDDLKVFEAKSNTTSFDDMPYYKKKLLKITDLIGREINTRNINDYSKTTLIYIYSDGSVEKVVKN